MTAPQIRSSKAADMPAIAEIGDSSNKGSIKLHAACGFKRTGTLKAVGIKFGQWADSVIMQRTIGEVAKTLPPDREISGK